MKYIISAIKWTISIFMILFALVSFPDKGGFLSGILFLFVSAISNPIIQGIFKKNKIRFKKSVVFMTGVVSFIAACLITPSSENNNRNITYNAGDTQTETVSDTDYDIGVSFDTSYSVPIQPVQSVQIEESKEKPISEIQNSIIESDIASGNEIELSEEHHQVETNVDEGAGSFWIKFIDVGQGDSALIQCDGHYMMIDGGPSSASSVCYTILKNSGIDYLDYMIATHPDADHIGGLSGALNYSKVGICYSSVTYHDTKTFESLVKYLNEQNKSITVPKPGTKFNLGNATVEILGPIYNSADTNNNSIVAKITYGSTSFLFMGDAEMEEESSLINSGVSLSCDVLKVGHHGSNSSTGREFLAYSNPKYAVISVGDDNSYGHPHDETLSRLKAISCILYRTDLQGDILCVSDGSSISISTEKNTTEVNLWSAGSDIYSSSNDNVFVLVPNNEIQNDLQDVGSDRFVSEGSSYVLNNHTMKFHRPDCSSVKEISLKNREDVITTREELISQGYCPCKRCNP